MGTTEYELVEGAPPSARTRGSRPNQLVIQLDRVVEQDIRGPVRVARFNSPTGASRAVRALENDVKEGKISLACDFDFQTRVLYDHAGRKVGSGLWVQMVSG